MEPLRLLLVEDSPTDAKLVVHELRKGGRIVDMVRVETAEAMRNAFRDGTFDLIVSDWSMPKFSAMAALAIARELAPDLPFVIVSGTIGEEHAVAAMRAGANDYVLKDKLARLAPAVDRELRDHADRIARRKAEAQRQEAESRIRFVAESGLMGLVVADEKGTFVEANDAFLKMIGYSREDLAAGLVTRKGITPPDWYEADDAARVRLRASSNVPELREKEYLHKDGHRVPVLVGVAMLDATRGIGIVADLTASRRVEEASRVIEARYRRIIETTNQGVWMLDARGHTTFVNARMATMLGYEPREVVGRSVLDFVPDDWREIAIRELSRSVEAPMQTEGKMRRKDGSTVWVLLESTPTFDESGRFDGSFAMLMDVTERKQAEAALLVAGTRLQRLWDSGLVLITILGAAGQITDINDAGAAMLGYSREELLAGTIRWPNLTPPEWKLADEAALVGLAARGVAAPYEKELVRKDGSRLAIFSGTAMLGVSESIAVAVDISERKRAQTDLLQRVQMDGLIAEVGIALVRSDPLPAILEQCMEAMLRNLDAYFARIWTIEPGSEDLLMRASAGTTGGPPARIGLGQFVIGHIAETRRPHLSNDITRDPLLLEPAWAERHSLVGFAGHPLLVDGVLIGVVAVCACHAFSETERQGLGSVADALAVGIRRKMAEETGASLEAQLRQAQKMEAVGRLAGGVAHDFNNMLSVILSYGDLMLSDLGEGDPLRADLQEISTAANRAADLTRQLLMFSRQQVVEPKVLDLDDLLAGMRKMMSRLVGEDIELTTVPCTSLARVCVDPSSIEQVVMNLVVNARDAMPIGGKLTLETGNVELDEDYVKSHFGAKPGTYVMLSVSDTGTGMDKATMARIFEPFFTTKEKGKGTGLGLSTVFGIAQQAGGHIWVYSEPGVGTTFKLYLPRVDGEATQIRPRVSAAMRGTETVLLVEDEDQVRGVARGILERHGYTVLDARNAQDAIVVSEGYLGTIHLLLTDVVMPGMSGPELVKRLVRKRPAMKVLCMSGYTDDASVRHGVVDETFAYLQKPLTVSGLTRKVRAVLDAD